MIRGNSPHEIQDPAVAGALLEGSFFEKVAVLAPDLIFVLNVVERRYQYVNEAAICFLGRPRDELLSPDGIQMVVGRIHPDDLHRLLSHYKELLRSSREGVTSAADRSVKRIEYRLLDAEGRWRWLDSSDTVFERTVDGRVSQILGVARDWTVKKAIAGEAPRHEQIVRMVADGVPGMVAYWTSELRCSFANNAYLDWFGRRPEEVVGLHIWDLMSDELFRANEPFIRGVLRGEPQRFERTLTKSDGSIGHTYAQYVPDVIKGRVQGFFVLVSDITELKLAQDALRANEAELRKLAAVASRTHNAVILTDAAGRIEWVNDGFTRMTGYTLDDVHGRTPGSFLQGPESDPQVSDEMRHAVREGQGFVTEIINYHKSGRKYWVAIETRPIRDDTGRLTSFMAIESDITERKLSHDRLRLNECRLKLSLDVARMLSWDWIVGSNEVTFSEDYGAFYGLPTTGLLVENNNPVLAPVHPEDREPLVAAFRRSLESGEEFQFEFRGPPRNREDTWYFTRGRIQESHEGKPVRVIGITRDISLEKKAEQTLRRSNEELEQRVRARTSELELVNAQLREAQELAHIGDFVWNLNDGSTTWSDELFRIHGLDPESDAPSLDSYLNLVHSEHQEQVKQAVDELFLVVLPLDFNIEYRIVRPSGDIRWIVLQCRALFMPNGDKVLKGVVQDITEYRNAADRIERLRGQLFRTSQRVTMAELASGLAHELNQPLAALQLYASAASRLSTSSSSTEFQDCLKRISEQTSRAGEILRRLRTIVSQRPLQRLTCNVNHLIRDVLILMENDLKQSSVVLELNLDENLPLLLVNGIEIQQVLVNLIRNAIEAMAGSAVGMRTLCLHTTAVANGARVVISDTGCGVDPSITDKLFHPFQTTKPGRIGLGLPISQSLIEANGGSISVQSGPGEGTSACFFLPITGCVQSNNADDAKAAPPPQWGNPPIRHWSA